MTNQDVFFHTCLSHAGSGAGCGHFACERLCLNPLPLPSLLNAVPQLVEPPVSKPMSSCTGPAEEKDVDGEKG